MTMECTNQGKTHTHANFSEAMLCYGVIDDERYSRDLQVSRMMTRPAPVGGDLRPATESQVNYVGVLHGDVAAARTMTVGACSKYIDDLKSGAVPPMEDKTAAPEHLIPLELLELIDNGYYAARLDDKDAWRFFFVSRPNHGQYKGCIKVQMQHGSGYGNGNWTPCYVGWPSKKVSVYDMRQKDHIMICISGQAQAMRDYAQQIGRCCRCNAVLTDARSLWYGIGPECEKYNKGLIEDIGLEKGFFEDQP